MKKYLKSLPAHVYRQAGSRQGFSIIETILAAGIFASFIFVISSMQGNVATLENLVAQKLQSRGDLDQTFQIMVTEIRSAGPSSLGSYPIESAASGSIIFFSDVNEDGIFERIRYFLASTSTIKRGIITPTGNPLVYAISGEIVSTVIENVVISTSTDVFRYYDTDYTGTEAAMTYPIAIQDIRNIQITIYADVKPKVAPKPLLFTNTVTIRNLRSN